MNVLLTPARIGSVEIKNRIVMPPMTTRLSDQDGPVTARVLPHKALAYPADCSHRLNPTLRISWSMSSLGARIAKGTLNGALPLLV